MPIKKAGYRTMPIVNKNADNVEQSEYMPKWMRDYATKVSVQPYRSQDSIFEQISSIINSSTPKYSSVEDAVKDMQERSGLTAYQSKMKSLAQSIKIAGCACDEKDKKPTVRVFELKPQVQSTLDNFVTDTRGNLPIPAIIDKVKSIHRNDVLDDSAWDDDGLMQYVNDKCIEVKKMNPEANDDDNTMLGKTPRFDDKEIDQSNTDALFSLNPAVVK